ncbi:10672_t:CDS:1, partial [Paraglomus occultum]
LSAFIEDKGRIPPLFIYAQISNPKYSSDNIRSAHESNYNDTP